MLTEEEIIAVQTLLESEIIYLDRSIRFGWVSDEDEAKVRLNLLQSAFDKLEKQLCEMGN